MRGGARVKKKFGTTVYRSIKY